MLSLPFLGSTKYRVLRQLRQGSKTAAQIASALGIQVSAARKHLERLTDMEIVEERFHRNGPGRPKKLYSLTEQGRELFPRRYDTILNELLTQLVADRGGDYAERLLGRIAAERTVSIGGEPGTSPVRLRRLVAALDSMGFEATLKEEPGLCTITSHNCPILRTAQAHKELVCTGLHAKLIQDATAVPHVHRGKWIVHGDSVCTHQVPTPRVARTAASR